MKVNAAAVLLACLAGNVAAAPTPGSAAVQRVQHGSVVSSNVALNKREEDVVAHLREALKQHSTLALRESALLDLGGVLGGLVDKLLDTVGGVLGECSEDDEYKRDLVNEQIAQIREVLSTRQVVARDSEEQESLNLQEVLDRVVNILQGLLGQCDSEGASLATDRLTGLTGIIGNYPRLPLGPDFLSGLHPDEISAIGTATSLIGGTRNPLGTGLAPDLLGLDGILTGAGLPNLGLANGISSGLGNTVKDTLAGLTGAGAVSNVIDNVVGGLLGGGAGGVSNVVDNVVGGLTGGLLGGGNPLGGLLGGSGGRGLLGGLLKREEAARAIYTPSLINGLTGGRNNYSPSLIDGLGKAVGKANSGGPVGGLLDRVLGIVGLGNSGDVDEETKGLINLDLKLGNLLGGLLGNLLGGGFEEKRSLTETTGLTKEQIIGQEGELSPLDVVAILVGMSQSDEELAEKIANAKSIEDLVSQ